MKKDSKVLSSSLSELIAKFSQNDVIAVMEKEYQSAPAKLISISLIDDVSFVSSAKVKEEIIERYAEGLKEKGFFAPLLVRPNGGRFEVVLGRKRLYGAKKAGLATVPSVVRELSDEETLLMLLADARDQREIDVIEMALVCQRLSQEHGYSHKMLADVSHQSRCQITNILRLLRLPKWIQDKISIGEFSYGHAKAIASLPVEEAEKMAKRVSKEKLSVRQTEVEVRNYKKGQSESISKDSILSTTNAKQVTISKKGVTFVFANEKEKEAFLASLVSKKA